MAGMARDGWDGTAGMAGMARQAKLIGARAIAKKNSGGGSVGIVVVGGVGLRSTVEATV